MLLNVKNDIGEIERICNDLKAFCASNDIGEKKCFDIVIIVDEMATNVINYAYDDNQEHTFILSIEKNEELVHIQIIDDGVAFDPLQKTDPDLDSSLDDRQIGGLGVFFAKRLSQSITYTREDGKNHLDIIVNIIEEEEEGVK